MKAATAKVVLADLGNVVGNSDLSSEYLRAALTDTDNVVSAVFSGEKAVAAVVWRRQRKGLRIIAAAGTGGRATHLVAALEESWQSYRILCRRCSYLVFVGIGFEIEPVWVELWKIMLFNRIKLFFIYYMTICKFDLEICIAILQLLLILILAEESFENRELSLKLLYSDVDCIFCAIFLMVYVFNCWFGNPMRHQNGVMFVLDWLH